LNKSKSVAVIVAHPDDETLWAGGMILSQPLWDWYIITLCRKSDPDRAPKFYRVLETFHAKGDMGDLDDGPEQNPLHENLVKTTVIQLLPDRHFDLLITHDPSGEYTRHLRHEETSRAVITLWFNGRISAEELWTFAYEDGRKAYFPRPVKNADIHFKLPKKIWQKKYQIITETYGFKENSFEAQTTPCAEAFWQFGDPGQAREWFNKGGNKL
jgi:LmbE family N-acetylglucosaminyl deacetylase